MLLEKCAYCGDMTDMPFECNYCKDPFCSEHRLPEEHRCVKLSLIRAKKFGEKKVIRDGGPNKPNIFKRFFGVKRNLYTVFVDMFIHFCHFPTNFLFFENVV